jgi:E3 ubiquitin-protein ligase RNF213
MCYHSRLPTSEARYNYRLRIREVWNQHRHTAGVGRLTDEQFLELLENEQKDILERMLMKEQDDGTRQLRKDWEGTAMNGALLENVFVLMICILNRIPVFLVGKPGSSKSLSMKLIYRSVKRGLAAVILC